MQPINDSVWLENTGYVYHPGTVAARDPNSQLRTGMFVPTRVQGPPKVPKVRLLAQSLDMETLSSMDTNLEPLENQQQRRRAFRLRYRQKLQEEVQHPLVRFRRDFDRSSKLSPGEMSTQEDQVLEGQLQLAKIHRVNEHTNAVRRGSLDLAMFVVKPNSWAHRGLHSIIQRNPMVPVGSYRGVEALFSRHGGTFPLVHGSWYLDLRTSLSWGVYLTLASPFTGTTSPTPLSQNGVGHSTAPVNGPAHNPNPTSTHHGAW